MLGSTRLPDADDQALSAGAGFKSGRAGNAALPIGNAGLLGTVRRFGSAGATAAAFSALLKQGADLVAVAVMAGLGLAAAASSL